MGDLSNMVKDLRNVYLKAGKVISEFAIPPSVNQSQLTGALEEERLPKQG